MTFRFEWDEEKAQLNLQKHGVSFDEALTVFGDINSITIHDVYHSDDEDRFIDLGFSSMGRLLVVVYTDREDRIRLISAREATNRERRQYERQYE